MPQLGDEGFELQRQMGVPLHTPEQPGAPSIPVPPPGLTSLLTKQYKTATISPWGQESCQQGGGGREAPCRQALV